MPQYEPYKGEDPKAARRRIAYNRSIRPAPQKTQSAAIDTAGYAQRVQDIRPVKRDNTRLPTYKPGDKEESSVLLEQADNYAYPRLFPRDPKTVTSHPDDWLLLEGDAAWEMAKERGELFKFNTDKDADAFARGNWKPKKKK